MLDDKSIKTIMFACGGYGNVHIIDKIGSNKFVATPKWLIGYSNIMVFLNHVVRNLGIQTLHASMPINFADNRALIMGGVMLG